MFEPQKPHFNFFMLIKEMFQNLFYSLVRLVLCCEIVITSNEQ